ncbi:trehalose operon repressor [Alloiococcus sp. CFN-8]|uniref:trehalose operon repressor n=1 Tax=Alloiococcus sp. CFN-8 TaxID=3416081 RepID=UPI003CEAD5F3
MDSKYIFIYNDILTKIEEGAYKRNDKLPSEKELMDEYEVSRDTIRKALKLLEEEGIIHKIKGKGSLILDINKLDLPVSGITSFKELAKNLNMPINTILYDLSQLEGDSVIREKLALREEAPLWRVIRIREFGGKKVILDKDYFNGDIISELTEAICLDSIYEYIEEVLGLKIAFAHKEITVETATLEDKKLLDCEGYDMIVVVKSFTYLDDTRLFQYTESRHRPDKFKFVDFARRTKG